MIKQTPPSSSSTIIIVCLFWFLLFGYAYCFTLENNGDYAALLAFKTKLILEPDNILSTNWTSNTHYCTWFGVSCFNHRVTKLVLSGLAVRGELSQKFASLTHLEELDLRRNELGGILPSEFGSLQRLRILRLTNNALAGSIPVNLSRCWKLEVLNLAGNFIAGSIPEELGYLTNLRYLDISGNNLTGNIPASLGNFSSLEAFYLEENDLDGAIPAELGKLTRLSDLRIGGNNLVGNFPDSFGNFSSLEELHVEENDLDGTIPADIGKLTRLSYLWMFGNNLVGNIPDSFGNFSNLLALYLDSNRITGKIPVSLSNATKLIDLSLFTNDLEGEIPNEFSTLLNLQSMNVGENRISGGIPYGIFNITTLVTFAVGQNYLSGNLPPDIGNGLPNLQHLFLINNQFSGEIPPSICNATNLTILDVSNNTFSGPVPMMLGNLVHLESLQLGQNSLTNSPASTHLEFLTSLVNCRSMQYLDLSYNPLNSQIPESISNMSINFNIFNAASCGLRGRIPLGFGNMSGLNSLSLETNDLQGSIPLSFAGLRNLESISLSENRLEGSVPTVCCSIHIMGFLYLRGNKFSGSIPTCFQNLTRLRKISLAANKLNSSVPLEFWKLENLQELDLSRNVLYGSIPVEVGNMKVITTINLSSNDFTGEIPSMIGSLQNLQSLDMSRNNLEGPIPNSFRTMIVIRSLDLSFNSLSGEIPTSLGSLRDLQYLNLSFNRLQGEIPSTGVFVNITFQSLMGNPNLCGAPNLNFPVCSPQASGERKRTRGFVLKITVPIATTALLVFTMILLWIKLSRGQSKKAKANIAEISMVEHRMITRHELMCATESFSLSNLLGEGSSAMVYKAVLSDETVAAVKVFNMQYVKVLRNFDAECEVLRNVRHRNLVKIISTCTNLEFKAMILEFMSNGSLDMRLHSQSISLSLVERLDIVTDVAVGMEYLHHEYKVPIVHCDLKPANVLLNEDMTAHVADFGISKILAQDQEFVQTNTLGTIGYMAPEYGLDGHASTKGDVYSFGILLLETFTRKRPTDDMFKEGLSLHQWVYQVFPDALVEVLDSHLFAESSATININHQHIEDILVSIVQVALMCLEESPEERIDMKTITAHLKKIRVELKKKSVNNARRST